jgi:hypothetical protein
MSDTRTSMREFRFLDEKRKMGSLSPAEEARWTELRGLLGVQDAPVQEPAAAAGYPQQPQGYYGADGQWYAYPAGYEQQQPQGYYGADGQWYAAPAPYPPQPQGYYGQDGQWYPYPQGYPQQGYDPNQAYAYPQQGYDPNQAYAAYPQQGYDPNQAYADPQQGYDPNQAYAGYPQQGYDPNQAAYDPSQGYATQAQYPGMDPSQGYAEGYAQPYEQAQAPVESAWPAPAEATDAQPAPAPEPAQAGAEEADFAALSTPAPWTPPAETPAETAPASAELDAAQPVEGDDLLEVSADEITDVEEASTPAQAEAMPAPVSEEAPTALAADSYETEPAPASMQDAAPVEESAEPIELQADDVALIDGDTEPAAPQQELQPEPQQELQPEPSSEPVYDTAPASDSSTVSWDSAPLAVEAQPEPVSPEPTPAPELEPIPVEAVAIAEAEISLTEPAPAPEPEPIPVEAVAIAEAEISLTSSDMIEETPASAAPEPSYSSEMPVMDLGQEPPAQPQASDSPEVPTFDVAELGAEVEPEPSTPVLTATPESSPLEVRSVQVGPSLEADTIELTEDAIESSQPTPQAAAEVVPWETEPEEAQPLADPTPSAPSPVEDIDLSGSPEEAVPLATNADFVPAMTESASWQSDRSLDLSSDTASEAVTDVIELTEASIEPPQPAPATEAAADGWNAEAPVMDASALETPPPPIEIDAEWGAPAPPENPWAEPAQPAMPSEPNPLPETRASTPSDWSAQAQDNQPVLEAMPEEQEQTWDATPAEELQPQPEPQPQRAEWAEPEPEWIDDPPKSDLFGEPTEISKLAAEDPYAPREQWPEGPSPFDAPMADLTAGTHGARQYPANPSAFGAPMQNLSDDSEMGTIAMPAPPPPPAEAAPSEPSIDVDIDDVEPSPPTEDASPEPSIDVTFDDAPPPPPAGAADLPVMELGDVEFTEEPAPAAPAVIAMPPPPPAVISMPPPPPAAARVAPAPSIPAVSVVKPPPPPPAARAAPVPSPGVARPSAAPPMAAPPLAPVRAAITAAPPEEEIAIEEVSDFQPVGPGLAAPAAAQLSFFVEGEHRVIIHTVEGQVKRGVIRDVDLLDESIALEQQTGFTPERIPGKRVKAIFFMLPAGGRQPQAEGQKIRVTFSDGRQMAGFSKDFKHGGEGFFFIPADNRTNTARIFVYRSNVQAVAEG